MKLEINNKLENYPTLSNIIDNNDIIKWKKLEEIPKYYNILSLLYYSDIQKNNQTFFKPYIYAVEILNTLEKYLTYFPELQENKSFKKKIKNLNGYSFFYTMTELSIAYLFLKNNYKISFEEKFIQNGKIKDVDIKVFFQDKIFYIEAYTPTNIANIDDFFNLNEYTNELKNKIRKKTLDKFSNVENKLIGKRYLAINTYLSEIFNINILLKNKDIIYTKLRNNLPIELDGLIIFYDNFNSIDSLKIEYIDFEF